LKFNTFLIPRGNPGTSIWSNAFEITISQG